MSFGLQQLKTNLVEILSVEGNPGFLSASPFSDTLYDARKGTGIASKYFWFLTDNFLDSTYEESAVNRIIRKTAEAFKEYFIQGSASYNAITRSWEKQLFEESEQIKKEKMFFCEFHQTFYPLYKLLKNPKTLDQFQKIFRVFSENFQFDTDVYENFSKLFHIIQFENLASAEIPWIHLAKLEPTVSKTKECSISKWLHQILNPPFFDFYTKEGINSYLEEASKLFRKCIYFIYQILEKQKLNTCTFEEMLGVIYANGGKKLFAIIDKKHVKWLASLDEKSEFVFMGGTFHMKGKPSLQHYSSMVPILEDSSVVFFFSLNRLLPLALYGFSCIQKQMIPFVHVKTASENENRYFLTETLYERLGGIDWSLEANKIRMLQVVELVSSLERHMYMPLTANGTLPPSAFGFTYRGDLKVDVILYKNEKSYFALEKFVRELSNSTPSVYSHIYNQCLNDVPWTIFFKKIFIEAIKDEPLPSYFNYDPPYWILPKDMETIGKPYYDEARQLYIVCVAFLRNNYSSNYSMAKLQDLITEVKDLDYPGFRLSASQAAYFGEKIATHLKLVKRAVPLNKVNSKKK